MTFGNAFMKILEFTVIPIGLLLQGLGVTTPVILGFLPSYGRIFRRLWERHKNPISWGCRPFFGLVASYGAILHNWVIILIGFIGVATSWFWFPKWENTPKWAEDFINRELEVITPENHWDLRRVILPSLGLPIFLGGFLALLWFLPYPWNWLALLIYVLVTMAKIIWSGRQEKGVTKPLVWIVLIGYALGVVAGIPLLLFLY
jgi:hypothetical protein